MCHSWPILVIRSSTRGLHNLLKWVFCNVTDTQTNRQTDIETLWLNRPMGRFSENSEPEHKFFVYPWKTSLSTAFPPQKNLTTHHTSPGTSVPESPTQPKFSLDSFMCDQDKRIQCAKQILECGKVWVLALIKALQKGKNYFWRKTQKSLFLPYLKFLTANLFFDKKACIGLVQDLKLA